MALVCGQTEISIYRSHAICRNKSSQQNTYWKLFIEHTFFSNNGRLWSSHVSQFWGIEAFGGLLRKNPNLSGELKCKHQHRIRLHVLSSSVLQSGDFTPTYLDEDFFTLGTKLQEKYFFLDAILLHT